MRMGGFYSVDDAIWCLEFEREKVRMGKARKATCRKWTRPFFSQRDENEWCSPRSTTTHHCTVITSLLRTFHHIGT